VRRYEKNPSPPNEISFFNTPKEILNTPKVFSISPKVLTLGAVEGEECRANREKVPM
jgi:hypothetical protein